MRGLKYPVSRVRIATATTRSSTQNWLRQNLSSEDTLELMDVSSDPVRRLGQDAPDIVILEVKTPSTHGLGLLRQIKSLAPDVPVLVVTGAISSTQAHKVLRDGAEDCIVLKHEGPFLPRRVYRVLEAKVLMGTASTALGGTDKLQVALPELHDDSTGRLDAEKIAQFLDVPLSKLASAIDAPYSAVHKTPAAESLQEALFPIKRSLQILTAALGQRPSILKWLNSPHPDLDMRTPVRVILDGEVGAVKTVLENAIAGTPT